MLLANAQNHDPMKMTAPASPQGVYDFGSPRWSDINP